MDEQSDPEVSSLDSRPRGHADLASGGPGRRVPAALRTRQARVALTSLVLLAALAWLIGALFPDLYPRATAALFPLVPTPVPTTTPVIPTPLPAVATLAPAPTDCPPSPPLDSMVAHVPNFSEPVTLYGRPPVWLPEPYPPRGTIHLGTPDTPIPYPESPVDWVVGPATYPTVTAQVTDLQTGGLAWWSGGSPRPQVPIATVEPRGLGAWRGALWWLIFTHAGCYRLDVAWQGGAWSSIFAVGG